MYAKDIVDNLFRKTLLTAGVADDSILHKEKLVTEIHRLIEIVKRTKDSDILFLRQLLSFLNDQLFVGDIQIAGRFIKIIILGS